MIGVLSVLETDNPPGIPDDCHAWRVVGLIDRIDTADRPGIAPARLTTGSRLAMLLRVRTSSAPRH